MSVYLDKRFSALKAYTPGEQPQGQSYIKLNTNESPFPSSDKVLLAAREEAEKLNLYSDPECRRLRSAAAELFGVETDNVLAFNGSDEVLNFAFMAFCGRAAFPATSYGFYPVFAQLYGIDALEVPLQDDLSINYRDFCALDRAVVIANPNAPTGLALTPWEIEQIVCTNRANVVVIDEAYVAFGAQSVIPLIEKYDNLLVTRTFSKSHSLAGARLGFGIGSAELMQDLDRIRCSTNPYNVNRMTQAAGIAAIEDNDYYISCCRTVAATRDATAQALIAEGFELTRSMANFLFIRSDKISGRELYEGLKKRGVLVRWFDKPGISDRVRVSVGTDEQMNVFLGSVREVINEKK